MRKCLFVTLAAFAATFALMPAAAQPPAEQWKTMVDKANKTLAVNWDDELVKATALTKDGAVIHPNFQPKA